ncbi:cation:proton antiporter [Clostridium sporogenes]|uniref:Cation:proton antiporter n=1 Tax=Clostridium botulinum TaxID=1491 RepID=A0A6M0SZW1_CLOBO|nr:cation:proton antiporter [Clostridium sporogenes]NFA61037.1 cation:proton antiporter [Clostridium botulinum]NFI73763.1 cation:proton antiporter [Clostridium sporogenes]NFL73592.1 cation:proton antiporter [Clostridium sporogenes]NFM25925.1 cation:proton antiporter [Clostridium sporogenes]NFP61637.1 cation:proton antiporter [Clostridium sporogenes]
MNPFIGVGIALIVGVLFGKIMNRFKIPAVAGYIIAGLVLGVSGFNLENSIMIEKLSFIGDFALGIIAFNIGSELEVSVIKKLGKPIFIIAFFEATLAFAAVTIITLILGEKIYTALILGAVASATAPAATVMVLKEMKAKGPLTTTLLGVVAVDDAICLMIYSVASSLAKVFIANKSISAYSIIVPPLVEIFFSLLAGFVLGAILIYILNKCSRDSEIQTLTLGAIIILTGLCIKFNLSSLLASMCLGITVANLSAHSNEVFSTIENFASPVITAFFVLAGARLDIRMIPKIGILGICYLVFRMIGKVSGASLGATISKAPEAVRKYIGYGLFSQIGVAVGLAIIVSREFKGTGLDTKVLTILLATTIITEIIGPLSTKTAIIKAKEANI